MKPRFARPPAPERPVRCCWCGHAFAVPKRAQSVVCPGCHKRAQVDDVVVRRRHWGGGIATCGRLVVERQAEAAPGTAIAGEGIEVFGSLEADIETMGSVIVGPKGVLRGKVRAAALLIEPGGDATGVDFAIRSRKPAPTRATLPMPTARPKPSTPGSIVEAKRLAPKSEANPADASSGSATKRVTRGGTVRLRID